MQLKIGKKERLHIHSCDILISHLYTIRKKSVRLIATWLI